MYDLVRGQFEFCSHVWTIGDPLGVPQNLMKMLLNLLMQRPKTLLEQNELYTQFEDNIRNVPIPQRTRLLEVVYESGWFVTEFP